MGQEDTEAAQQILKPRPTKPDPIVTLGYVGLSIAEISSILRTVGVFHIIDVRARPAVSWPHMDEVELEQGFGAFRMTYEPRPELGTPEGPTHDARIAGFENDRMGGPEFMKAVREFAERAHKNERFALMCFESDYKRCHRRHLADGLIARGIEVIHLMGHQPWNPEDIEVMILPTGVPENRE